MTAVAVLGVGVCCPLGSDLALLVAALDAGTSALAPHPPLANLPTGDLAGVVAKPDLKPWLRRRKDRKIMARASELALAAAGPASVGSTAPVADMGVFIGVGREPPDDGDSEAALAAAALNGRLDDDLLAGPGRDRYPPLLPLKTLPNMVLAHISINLGYMGENGAWAGEGAAGLRALVAAVQAVSEGRCPEAMAGGADSLVGLGNARDRLRMGASGPPGEGAAVLRLGPLGSPGTLAVLDIDHGAATDLQWRPLLGDLGAAAGVFEVAILVASGRSGRVVLADPGEPPVGIAVRSAEAC